MKNLKVLTVILLMVPLFISCVSDDYIENGGTLTNNGLHLTDTVINNDNGFNGEWVHTYSYKNKQLVPFNCKEIKKTYIFGKNGRYYDYNYGYGETCSLKTDMGTYYYFKSGRVVFELNKKENVFFLERATKNELRLLVIETGVTMVLKRLIF